MTAFKQDSDGDKIVENGSFVILDDLATETSQRLRNKFRFFLGEWHLDPRQGFPLLEQVLIKSPDLRHLRVLFRETIEGDEGVSSLDELTFDFDTQQRILTVSFFCTLIDGSTLDIADFILGENL